MTEPAYARDENPWDACRFLTCSVLPVRMACNLHCPFCFSKSSVSALAHEGTALERLDVLGYYRFARARGATRLVITGGGEPLLRPDLTVELVRIGRQVFDEVTCFTNGTYLTAELASRLADAGLSYVCWSRHAASDDANRALMGAQAPSLDAFVAAAGPLRIRATCVMARGSVEDLCGAEAYMQQLGDRGITEFTFKHTYTAYSGSLFRSSRQDRWARANQVDEDPFVDRGEIIGALPWGPKIRRIGEMQVCFYREPTPQWELTHRLCRSSNLLSDGKVYASLEETQSLLFQLNA
jgi:cyclic pyranopterin phosphate synthase